MKKRLLVILVFTSQVLCAQTFTEVVDTPFEGIYFSSVAYADIDSDGDQDILVTGHSETIPVTKLYLNELGVYTEIMDTPFEGVYLSAIAFGDIDMDGDPDLIITGRNLAETPLTKLYINDGGSFSEMENTTFEGVSACSLAFNDVDGDGDLDLLISGENTSNEASTKLYINDNITFNESLNNSFVNVYSSAIAFSDIDNDGDSDVLITGMNNSFERIAELYTNEGGEFTQVLDTPFDGVVWGAISFADIDGDDDEDVIISGEGFEFNSTAISTKLYSNTGGTFTEVMNTPLVDVFHGTITFSDIDNDNDSDVLITGVDLNQSYKSVLYLNNGGAYTEVVNTPFENVALSSVAFLDIDGDDDEDLVITGGTESGPPVSKLYLNDFTSSIVKHEDLQFDFTLFPNPAVNDKISISYTSVNSGFMRISIFDITGRLLSQRNEDLGIGYQTVSADVSSLSKGCYFVRLTDGNRIGVREFIVP